MGIGDGHPPCRYGDPAGAPPRWRVSPLPYMAGGLPGSGVGSECKPQVLKTGKNDHGAFFPEKARFFIKSVKSG